MVVGLDAVTDPVFGVLDNVGGKLLAQAFSLVSDGGSVQSIGMASNEPTTIDFEAERRRGHRKRLEPFTVRAPFQADLAYLLTLVADGELDPQIGLRDSWGNIAAAPTPCSTERSPARRCCRSTEAAQLPWPPRPRRTRSATGSFPLTNQSPRMRAL
ncbi:hypothetical protein BN970_05159 [Mycolicibacterium conceptionense]|uniref:Uncharacterized protein n=1 Tax=Mycolicibacterium conceptionense TaxID=451644 RepID=A0A0U1DTV7_9MYCO|nr:hypothetical protein BN970_05159 [Mycolicibacterium conceptionense]